MSRSQKTLAASADKHALYEQATQQPELTLGFIEDVAERIGFASPQILKEDFCGTAHLAASWALSRPNRRAIGVDLDPKVLAYAERHHRQPLGPHAKRLKLRQADVMRCSAKADAIAALNFSTFIYKTRQDLLRYFKHVRRCLRDEGLFVMDAYGGPGAWATGTDRRPMGEFEYQWEQTSVNPETAEVTNHIHFRFPDQSIKRKAFTYHWRLWTLAELRETLHEAGFEVAVWYEDEDGFIDGESLEPCEAYVAYLVAV